MVKRIFFTLLFSILLATPAYAATFTFGATSAANTITATYQRNLRKFNNKDWDAIAADIRSGVDYSDLIGETGEIQLGALESWGTEKWNAGFRGGYTDGAAIDIPEQVATVKLVYFDPEEKQATFQIVGYATSTLTRYLTSTGTTRWSEYEIREWLNDEYYNALPEELQDLIIDTTIYSNGKNVADVCVDKIFLPSVTEVNKSSTKYTNETNCNIWSTAYPDATSRKFVASDDYSLRWWLRTVDTSYKAPCAVFQAGTIRQQSSNQSCLGIFPAFNIK